MNEYHRHADGQVVPGEALRCIDPDAGAHDVIVLNSQGLGAHLTRLLNAHWPNSGVNPWLLADLLRANENECLGCGGKPARCLASRVKCCPDCTHTAEQLEGAR